MDTSGFDIQFDNHILKMVTVLKVIYVMRTMQKNVRQ